MCSVVGFRIDSFHSSEFDWLIVVTGLSRGSLTAGRNKSGPKCCGDAEKESEAGQTSGIGVAPTFIDFGVIVVVTTIMGSGVFNVLGVHTIHTGAGSNSEIQVHGCQNPTHNSNPELCIVEQKIDRP
jgi:predicted metalloprotease